MQKFRIKSVGRYLPGNLVDSSNLESELGIPEGWMNKNIGVQSRYKAHPSESVASIGSNALREALSDAHWDLSDLDLLICSGGSYDHPIPHTSCLIKEHLEGNSNDRSSFNCFDIDSTCLSFLQAMEVAVLYFQKPEIQRIAIVSAEIPSRALNRNDPKTYGLFGDCAVAVLLEKTEESEQGYCLSRSFFRNNSKGARYAIVPTGGSVRRGFESGTATDSFFFHMEGRKLIKLTLRELAALLHEITDNPTEYFHGFDKIITHQTSKFGNEFLKQKYNLGDDLVVNTLENYGNCVSASLALGLYEYYKSAQFPSAKQFLMMGSGAGLTIGLLEFRLQ